MNSLDLTKKLIAFESTKDNMAACREIVQFCADYFADLDVSVDLHECNGFPSVMIGNNAKGKFAKVMLYSHIDVVPGGADQFFPEVKDGRLYGRGAADMKSAAAVVMNVFKEAVLANPEVSLSLMLTTDEEVGGENGAKYLLGKGYSAEVVLIPDSSRGSAEVVISQKGILHLKIVAKGKSAHASRPHLGDNAIDKLIAVYGRVREFVESRCEGCTMNLGIIGGGDKFNKIPDEAWMEVDYRFLSDLDKVRFLEFLDGCEVEYEVLIEASAYEQDADDLWIENYEKSVQRVLGGEVKRFKENGGSDARFFCDKGVPAVITGIAKANAHALGEYCELEDLENFEKIVMDFVENYG